MAQSTAKAVSADELAFKQRKLGYRLKKSRVSYVMMAPYFILFFLKFSSTLFLLIRHQRLYTKRFPILRAYHIYNAC